MKWSCNLQEFCIDSFTLIYRQDFLQREIYLFVGDLVTRTSKSTETKRHTQKKITEVRTKKVAIVPPPKVAIDPHLFTRKCMLQLKGTSPNPTPGHPSWLCPTLSICQKCSALLHKLTLSWCQGGASSFTKMLISQSVLCICFCLYTLKNKYS